MDDLSGLEWSAKSTGNDNKPSASHPGSFYPPLRPTPSPSLSGTSTPLSAQASGNLNRSASTVRPSSKLSTPVNDSFSNLVSFNSNKPTSSLSLQERQKQLQEEKARQEAERQRAFDAQFGGQDLQFFDALGGQKATGQVDHGSDRSNNVPQQIDHDDDLLSAFSADAKVDSSTNFPPRPASTGASNPSEPRLPQTNHTHGSTVSNGIAINAVNGGSLGDDDDPFGLSQTQQPQRTPNQATNQRDDDEDDVLGLLGKPVSELPPSRNNQPREAARDTYQAATSRADRPEDRAVAELADMGFSADKAREALATTGSGQDVQEAVGWLLSEAHRTSKTAAQSNSTNDGGPRRAGSSSKQTRHREHGADAGAKPAWMSQRDQSDSGQRRDSGQYSANGENDISQYASEVGSTLFKSANSLWNTGRKKVQKAVTELQSDGDPSRPKWMRDAEPELPSTDRKSLELNGSRTEKIAPKQQQAGRTKAPSAPQQGSITDEALLLESGSSRPPRKQGRAQMSGSQASTQGSASTRDQSPAFSDTSMDRSSRPQSAPRTDRTKAYDIGPRGRLSKQEIEEQSSQAYVSPARRKKQAPKAVDAEPNLLLGDENTARATGTSSALSTNNPFRQTTKSATNSSKVSTPIPTRPKAPAPARETPTVSSLVLSNSASHRQKGTEAFKRGDYSTAHTLYSSALAPLPKGHPVIIVVLCNRALVNLKNGDPKAAVADADSALSIIGPSRGEGEKVSLGGNEGDKNMRDYYGKALMRKAEALEQMEKWIEAANAWKEAVEAGVGGATSMQGRTRSEKAAGKGSSNKAPAPRRPTPAKKPPAKKAWALADLSGRPEPSSASSAEAVTRLREANAAAEHADDEKFALADSVDAKLTAWKGGKQDNLRALLGSLDTVLWPEAGWRRVGMHELVLANKVKVVYMKGISKVHPDKV